MSILQKRNKVTNVDPRFKDTVYLVEASHCEVTDIWSRHHDSPAPKGTPANSHSYNIPWKQDSGGFMIQVGTILGRPIVISIFWNTLFDNCLVGFYEATSELVDHKMINEYLDEINKVVGKDIQRTNAQNFHHCLHFCQEKTFG